MVADAGADRSGSAGERVPWVLAIPGLLYPLWRTLAPSGTFDPWWAWLAVGACFVAMPALYRGGKGPWSNPMSLIPALASLVALHFFLLATLNEMNPFYAVGSTMAGLAPVLFIRSRGGMLAYGAFIGALATGLYLADPDERKLAYWGSLFPVLVFGYRQVARQNMQTRLLEDAVVDRTQQLSDANHRLRSEIDARVQLEDELRVHHKMEAVGRLAGGVAHDFNNLLTTIGVYAELLEQGLSADDPHRKEVEHIQHANRQAAALTQQLLTVGRRSHVRVVGLDLNEVVSEAASVLSHLLGPEVELVCRCGEGRHPIRANPDQLQQILINLATNARDAMAARGVVKIETCRCPAEDLSSMDAKRELTSSEYVRLSFTDSGAGMSARTLERIFEPFFTTKGPERGVGLGLAIVHGIVSQGGGFIRVQSELGRGSHFELYWPLDGRTVEDLDVDMAAPTVVGREEILLVEDETDLRRALVCVLRNRGFAVSEASSGTQALEIIVGRGRPFDLLVTDVVMVRMSGFDLAKRVAEHHPKTKVLLISGHLGEGSMLHAPPDLPLLLKPFTAEQLASSVRRALDEKSTR